jgi:hypothetical protein
MLQAFPGTGKIAHSERFILNNFLGHEFLRAAYTADYMVNGQNFQLFVLNAGSEAAARTALEKYAALERGQPQPVLPPGGTLTIHDPYNGPVRILWQGRFICGGRAPASEETIAGLARNLPKQ